MVQIPSPLDDLVKNFADLIRQHGNRYAQKQARQLAKVPYALFRGITTSFYETVKNKIDTAKKQTNKMYDQFLNGSHIRIDVETSIIASQPSSKPTLIPVKIKFTRGGKLLPYSTGFQNSEVDGFVAYQWSRLGKFYEKTINIIDFLPLFLPRQNNQSSQGPIGLVTFQNGIRNNYKDEFKDRCQLVLDQFPEGPLFIGLYNPMVNFINSFERMVWEELLNTSAVYSLCQTMKTIADRFSELGPNLIWTHFAHSEGGLIAHTALDIVTSSRDEKLKKYLREHLVTATFGPVKPVPTNPVLRALNTYSSSDIALTFGQSYLDKSVDQISNFPHTSIKMVDGKTYKVSIVKSTTKRNDPFKFALEPPPVKSLQELLDQSWWEWLARLDDLEGSKQLAYTPALINRTAYAVADHGFIEDTYKKAIATNVGLLKRLYKMPTFTNYRK